MLCAWSVPLVTGCVDIFEGRYARRVELSIRSSENRYAPGEAVKLTLSLTNSGSADIYVSDFHDGNYLVKTFERDGRQVRTRSAHVWYDRNLAVMLEQSLSPLRPGTSLTVGWVSEMDRGLGAMALGNIWFGDDRRPRITYYDVSAPGSYKLVVAYKYGGRTGSAGEVFTGESNEAEVRFTVGQ